MRSKTLTYYFLLSIFSLLNFRYAKAQDQQAWMHKSIPKNEAYKIPFQYEQDFIILRATLDNRVPVRLLLDTGSEHTVLFSKRLTDLLGIEYFRSIQLMGSDMTRIISAFVTDKIKIDIADKVSVSNNILVLEEDAVDMDKLLGLEVDGVLGAEVFNNNILHMDFDRSVLRIIPRDQIEKKTRKHTEVASFFHANKPHFISNYRGEDKQVDSLALLMDSGSAIPFMLHANTIKDYQVPEGLIEGILGVGLGGYLKGYKGRVDSFLLSDIIIEDQVTHFQKLDSNLVKSDYVKRNGLVGNSMLCYLDPILDFEAEKIYIKPNYCKLKKRRVDRSGLFIVAGGTYFNSYHVVHVARGSPAHQAGVRKGDILRKLNGRNSDKLTLKKIQKKLRGKEGKHIRLRLLRGQERVELDFHLKKYL